MRKPWTVCKTFDTTLPVLLGCQTTWVRFALTPPAGEERGIEVKGRWHWGQ